MDYHELRAAERDILAGFLANVRVRTLASDTFSWADEIPHLINGEPFRARPGASGNGASDSFSWAEESPRLMERERFPLVPRIGVMAHRATAQSATGPGRRVL